MLVVVRISCVALVAACGFTPGMAVVADAAMGEPAIGDGSSAWLAPWTHRKTLTLQASQIEAASSALTDFPVFVTTSDPEITAALLPTGADLAFTSDDATTRLDHELESYESGQIVAWVKVPSLSATADTKLYIYYGNPTPPAVVPEATWSGAFLAVYHLQQDPGPGNPGDIRDATANHHDGTADPGMTTSESVPGPAGRAMQFNGSNDHIGVSTMDVGNAFTISMWMNMQQVNGIHCLLTSSPDGSNTNGFRFFVNSNGSSDRTVHLETGDGGNSSAAVTPGGAISTSQWTHVAAIVDRTARTATIVVNGVVATSNATILNDFSTASNFEIARMETNNPFPGTLDEVELASTTRAVEWLRTAYNNQHAPASFYVVGQEESR